MHTYIGYRALWLMVTCGKYSLSGLRMSMIRVTHVASALLLIARALTLGPVWGPVSRWLYFSRSQQGGMTVNWPEV